ncbi:acyl dehydratase [Rhodoligotrophos appendicifer]|uniref:MaoC family dehydratase n=1 Tax=Rhodoligotrophos appendicifer TaxID=987056 RepID=UPI001478FBC6|nr:MaoC family dehydratase [Rhodoligotrophos appendicifer]
MSELLYFEDFPVGRTFTSRDYELTADEIKSFAREYDWLPFHTDEEAAKDSFLGGLAASGWHVSAIVMRLIADSYILSAASMGSFGIEECKWLKPVRPGDVLTLRSVVVEARVSAKRPEMGIVAMLWELFRADGEKVTEVRGSNLFKTRASEMSDV